MESSPGNSPEKDLVKSQTEQCLQVVLSLECLGALVARVFAFVAVGQLVLGQSARVVEQLAADWAANHRAHSVTSFSRRTSTGRLSSVSGPGVMCS